jgi:hypothetical protein
MPTFSLLWKLMVRVPLPLRGPLLHRLGLAALYDGEAAAADVLFERAALRYRNDLAVEALARLRIHQSIARYRAGGGLQPESALEIERGLYRLRRIESLDPPHALMDAGRMLASWSRRMVPEPVPIHRALPPGGRRSA